MADPFNSAPTPLSSAPRPPKKRGALGGVVLAFSMILNFVLLGMVVVGLFSLIAVSGMGGSPSGTLHERLHSGQTWASDKIALVRIDGVIMEGLTRYAEKQIEEAAQDDHVKAVVLRINSPGGSITASDDLHRRLAELAKGNPEKKTQAKPLVVSMGGVAASGGYYIAMPARSLFAERTTITGSIGVYASLPNVKELTDKVGVKMNVIKAGNVKDSGSPFRDMSPEERLIWQGMVDHAYLQFIEVVEEGRPALKGKLQEDIEIDEFVPVRTGNEPGKQLKGKRYRADGGIFTADEARKYGLIDQVGYVEDAIQEAKKLAALGGDFKVIQYDKPVTLMSAFMGVDALESAERLRLQALTTSLTPRLWYLGSGCELAGLLAPLGR